MYFSTVALSTGSRISNGFSCETCLPDEIFFSICSCFVIVAKVTPQTLYMKQNLLSLFCVPVFEIKGINFKS